MHGNTPKPLDLAQTLYWVAMWTVVLFLSITAAQAGQVTLAWNASSGPVAGYHVHYGTTSGNYTASANASNTTQHTVANLTDGATYYFAVQAYDGAGNHSGFSNEVSTTIGAAPPPGGGALPSPWLGMDIGNVGLVGSASHANGTFTLQGSGTDIWGTTDAFHFAYQPLSGDGSIVARVANLTHTNAWAKAGVMIRENLDANARHALAVVTAANGVAFQHRTATGGTSTHTAGASVAAPYWVKLTRAGNTVTAHQSADGKAWTPIGSAVTLGMGATAYVGLALTSHNNGALNTATLDNVSVGAGAGPSTVAYTFDTQPSGLSLSYDGVSRATPFTVDAAVGSQPQISAPATQQNHNFSNWSDGGAATHTLTIGSAPQTLTATYVAAAPAPVAQFSANATSGPAPLTVQFANGSTDATTWLWKFGDGGESTARNPAYTYAKAGTYTVSLTATGAGGSHTATKTNYITVTEPAPVASFTASPNSGTAPLLVTLSCDSTGSITSRAWTFSDGTADSSPNVMKTFSAGNHTATLKVTGPGGSTTVTQTISVTASAPVADFTATPTRGTAPLRVDFTDRSSGGITGWSWNFGDGATSTAQHPTHTYQTAGTFTVSLTASGPGGTSSPKTTTITVETSTASSLPTPWQSRDIGSVGLKGSASHANGTFTLKGSGTDIWGTADAFHFAYQPLTGDGSIVARVSSLTHTHAWAKAGVMIRENLDANARHALVAVTPGNGAAFQHRTATGGTSTHMAGAAVKAPYWVKLTRAGNTFTAYQSANGSTWTRIGTAVTLNMASNVYVGLALTSHNNGALNTATLDQVHVSTSTSGPTLVGWDIGNVGLAGSTAYANGTFTLKGSGTDIWGTADAFHFAYQPLTGDGSIVARVSSLTHTYAWAKAGVMIREHLDANARHALVAVTPANGVAFQRRTATGGTSYHTAGAAVKAPYWVKLTRAGNTFTAHQSADGKTWTPIGTAVTLNMASSVYVGLALTSHNNGALNTAILDNVSIR